MVCSLQRSTPCMPYAASGIVYALPVPAEKKKTKYQIRCGVRCTDSPNSCISDAPGKSASIEDPSLKYPFLKVEMLAENGGSLCKSNRQAQGETGCTEGDSRGQTPLVFDQTLLDRHSQRFQ